MKLPREAQWGLIAAGISGGITLVSILGAIELTKSEMVSGKAALAISMVLGSTCGLVTSYAVGMSDRGSSGPVASLPPSPPDDEQPIERAMQMLGSHPASKVAVYNAASGQAGVTSRLYENALELDRAIQAGGNLFPEPRPEPEPFLVSGPKIESQVIHPGHDWEPDPEPLDEDLFSEPVEDDPWQTISSPSQMNTPEDQPVGW